MLSIADVRLMFSMENGLAALRSGIPFRNGQGNRRETRNFVSGLLRPRSVSISNQNEREEGNGTIGCRGKKEGQATST